MKLPKDLQNAVDLILGESVTIEQAAKDLNKRKHWLLGYYIDGGWKAKYRVIQLPLVFFEIDGQVRVTKKSILESKKSLLWYEQTKPSKKYLKKTSNF